MFVTSSFRSQSKLTVHLKNQIFRGKRQDLFNAMGSMYAAVLFIGIRNASAVQPIVAIERTVFYRERAAGMYSAIPYAFAQVRTFLRSHKFLYMTPFLKKKPLS